MKLPRVRFWDHFYILNDGIWQQIPPEDVAEMFNDMAKRYEIVLDDIEEIVSGNNFGVDQPIHSGPDVPTERSADTA